MPAPSLPAVRADAVRADDVRVPMRDGVLLAADVVRPDDDERHPVLLMRTPYSRVGLRETSDPIRWAREGWAVVLMDVRGRFDSGGEFRPFHQEVDDGYDSVEWCSSQPWSDGRVAMTGASYNGVTQWLAALSGHPALKAISPAVSAASYREDWFYEGGAWQVGFPTGWAAALAASATDSGSTHVKQVFKLARNWDRLLADEDAQSRLGTLFPDYGRWRDEQDTEYWEPLDVSRAFGRLDLPAWHLAGWYDVFCEGTLAAYTGMTANAASPYARRSQRLVVGPWTHAGVFQQSTAEVDWGLTGSGLLEGVPDEMRRFLSAAVDRGDVPTGVRVFVMGSNTWRDLECWPPPSTHTAVYLDAETAANGLTGDGRLIWSPPERRRVDGYSHDATDPVPTRGGRTLNPVLPMAGPMDQRVVEARHDVLVYTSAPLPRDLTVIGTVTASIGFASSAARSDVTVKLCDVHSDGRSMNVLDAVRRVDSSSSRPRNVEVRMGSTAMTFRRGHRLRVEVASSNFPRVSLLPSAEQSVVTGGARPSHLVLPVVSRTLARR